MTKTKVNKKFTNFGIPCDDDNQSYMIIPVADSVLDNLGLTDAEEEMQEDEVEEESKHDRKIFVLDTSVLLYDKDSMFKLKGNNLFIPFVVLEELDKFKDKSGLLGEAARQHNRFLDSLRDNDGLNEGVYVEEKDIFIKVWLTSIDEEIKDVVAPNTNDNLIVHALSNITKEFGDDFEVILITKDINLRVKCDALGLRANDYYADYEFITKESDLLYNGNAEVTISDENLNNLYKHQIISDLSEIDLNVKLYDNQLVVAKSFSGGSALTFYKNHELHLLPSKEYLIAATSVEGKNKEQLHALWMLSNPDLPLVTMTGMPGSGKTYITLMAALHLIEKKKYKRIIFTRPIQPVGKDIGFLPGDINEKMAPWLSPIVDNFRNKFGSLTYFETLMDNGVIDVAPLSYIRGRSFNDAIIIVDESQNATIHELKTIITRTGQNSKIVLLGDTDQVDLPYVDKFSNGLTIVIEKMKETSLHGHIHLDRGYRSDLASLAANLL
jgi:PhoH-like ATPase